MTVTALDTYEVVKELKAAGFSDQQAEAVTKVVRKSQDAGLADLVTRNEFQLAMAVSKADLEKGLSGLRVDLEKGLASVRADLDKGLASVRADLDKGLASVRADLDKGLASVRADLDKGLASARTDLAEVKADLMKWMVGSMGVQTLVILGAVAALVRMIAH